MIIVISMILCIISIFLTISGRKQINKFEYFKLIVLYIFYNIMFLCARVMSTPNFGGLLEYEPTFFEIYGGLIFSIIALVISIVIFKYTKVITKKEYKSLKGDK